MALAPSELLRRHGIQASKGLGQNFILDLNLTRKIVRNAEINPGDYVIEIGPGCGSLSIPILETGAWLTVVELDRRMFPLLEEIKSHYPNLNIIEGDALKVLLPYDNRPKIISNLPYHISAVLLVGWLERIEQISGLTLMFQKEMADRIIATPGSRVYGRLSVISQWRCKVRKVMDLPPKAFTPPPKISSTVLSFTPLPVQEAPAFASMETVLKHAFGQRRKMIKSAFKTLLPDSQKTLDSLGINPTARAEDLSVSDYVKIAEYYEGAVTPV